VKTNYSAIKIVAGVITATSLLPAFPSEAIKLVKADRFPPSGKILKLTSGDLMCYVDLRDSRGKKYNIGAIFEICNQPKFINRQVQLTYKRSKIDDCQSNEPCGKTRIENLIVKMKLVPRK
jgi:hypothetical protein